VAVLGHSDDLQSRAHRYLKTSRTTTPLRPRTGALRQKRVSVFSAATTAVLRIVMIVTTLAVVVAAVCVVLVFVSTALPATQNDEEDSCCENEGEDDECFHDEVLFLAKH
jgi:hypothetical protein